MIAGGLVLVAAVLVLRDDGRDADPASGLSEPSASVGQGPPSRAAEPGQRPRATLRPRFDGQAPGPATRTPDSFADLSAKQRDGMDALRTYRFRPLSERERQRMEQGPSDPYGSYPDHREPWQRSGPTPTGPGYRAAPTQPGRWTPEWEDRSWGTQGYSFRPLEPSGGTRQRWEGPYSAPRWPDAGYPPQPDPLQTPPQWGALPPDRAPSPYRQYRSHDVPRDRRFSLR
jgi:hypothetical protein